MDKLLQVIGAHEQDKMLLKFWMSGLSVDYQLNKGSDSTWWQHFACYTYKWRCDEVTWHDVHILIFIQEIILQELKAVNK